MGGGKVVDRGCSALESGVFVVTSCGEAARRGGGLCEQNLSRGAPLVQGVRCLARVGVSGVEGRTVFKHGNRSAVTRCHFFFAFPQAHLENSGTLLLEICGEIRVLSSEPPAG